MSPNLFRFFLLLALVAALLLVTYIVYTPGFSGPFLLDDGTNIPRTAVDSFEWESIGNHVLWNSKLGGFSRSLTNLTFTLSQFASGLDPRVFKYQNTLLHLVNGLLVFWLAMLLLGYRTADQRKADPLALAIAAVWLLHPLQVSTVLYATQRLVLLSTLFALLALVAYAKGRIWSFRRPRAALIITAAVIPLFGLLGILSKETAVLLPLYLAALELFFFRLVADSTEQRRLLHIFLVLLVAVPIGLGLFYGETHVDSMIGGYSRRDFTLGERLMTEVHAIGLYLKLFFLPLPATMSLFHDNFPIQRELDLPTAALALSYLAALVVAFRSRATRNAAIGFGILWFFLCHSLESTIISLEPVFEHRNYLAILGLAFILVLGMSQVLATPKLRRVTPVLTLCLVALLAFNTAARAFVWGNGGFMLRTQYLERPDSPRVLNGLFELELAHGNLGEARRYLQEAQSLEPSSPLVPVNMLRTYCTADEIPEGLAAEAREAIAQSRLKKGLIGALDSLTTSHLKGACPALGFAITHDLVTAYAESTIGTTKQKRFLALLLKGRLLTSQGLWDDAEACYTQALDLVDGSLATYSNLTINELVEPFLRAGRFDSLGRLLEKVAEPADPTDKDGQ